MFIDFDCSADQAALYEPPIKIIQGQLQVELEGTVMKAVNKVAVDVDKEELIRALKYDRDQYNKGFRDGVNYVVKHGRWIPKPIYKADGNGGVYKYCDLYFCSECATERPIVPPFNYCPNCGAKMDGDPDV